MTLLRAAARRVAIALAAVALAGCARAGVEAWWATGSVYRTRECHVGVRPAVSYPDGYGLTLQISR